MTQLLKQAFNKASRLPKVEQNMFARWALEELKSDKRWDETFAKSQKTLSRLAQAALREHAKGKTKKLSPDRL